MSPAVGETLDITANSTIQGLEARISISSEGIEQRVTDLEQGQEALSKLSADRWNVTVTSGTNGNFNSLFDQQASKITTFVRNDEFQSKFEQEAKSIRLEANQIYINGATFDSNSTMTLTAGNIGGWRVASQQLYAGSGAYRVGMQSIATSGSVSFYAGNETPTKAPFRVTNTGDVYAASFQGMGYVEAEKGKIGQWWIYPTDESYYKKWVITEYEMTDYDATRRGDIWTTGKWYDTPYSQDYFTYFVGLHVPDQTDFEEYPFTFYSGFMDSGAGNNHNSMMCAISYLGCVYTGAVYEALQLRNHTLYFAPNYGDKLCGILNNGHIYVTGAVHSDNVDVYGNDYEISMSGHQIFNSLNDVAYCTLTFGTDASKTVTTNGSLVVNGDLAITGNFNKKTRVINTANYGEVELSAYETTTPMFADIGESVINDEGFVRIYIDPIFLETIVIEDSYQVFLQKYGDGECYVDERNASYFVVRGTPHLQFAWEMKGKQIGIDQNRLYKHTMLKNETTSHNFNNVINRLAISSIDYGAQGAQYVQEQSA